MRLLSAVFNNRTLNDLNQININLALYMQKNELDICIKKAYQNSFHYIKKGQIEICLIVHWGFLSKSFDQVP